MDARRIVRHLAAPHWILHRAFPRGAFGRIEQAIKVSEARHDGELRFAVEAGIDLLPLLRGITPRHRAHEVFARLRVWDTEHNNGVLIYVQLIDRQIEIVADRGISAKVGEGEWGAICGRIREAFGKGRFEEGVLKGIDEISALLARHFPRRGGKTDELPDKPVVL